MAGLGVRLPLSIDSGDGFSLIKDFETMIKQNLKMLILTNPGERVMNPQYGVGISRFLFSNYGENIYGEIENRIREQASVYLPFVEIRKVGFSDKNIDRNKLGIAVMYAIPRIGIDDLLEFTI
jgi:hypothetical protein